MQSTSLLGAAAAPRSAGASRLVTDAPTRMFHWLFALSFLGAYLTADGERWRALHVTLGYTMAGLLAFRIVYGLIGPRQARLSLLWSKLSSAPQWLRSVANAHSSTPINWRQGQNLLMALGVALLLVAVLPLTLSGYATFHEWADGEWLEEIHEFFGNTMLTIVLAHLGLILGLSVLRRKNQALPMLTGRQPGPGPSLVQKNRAWLAALMLLSVLAYGAWEWKQAPNGLLPSKVWSSGEGGHHGRSGHRGRHHDDD